MSQIVPHCLRADVKNYPNKKISWSHTPPLRQRCRLPSSPSPFLLRHRRPPGRSSLFLRPLPQLPLPSSARRNFPKDDATNRPAASLRRSSGGEGDRCQYPAAAAPPDPIPLQSEPRPLILPPPSRPSLPLTAAERRGACRWNRSRRRCRCGGDEEFRWRGVSGDARLSSGTAAALRWRFRRGASPVRGRFRQLRRPCKGGCGSSHVAEFVRVHVLGQLDAQPRGLELPYSPHFRWLNSFHIYKKTRTQSISEERGARGATVRKEIDGTIKPYT